MQLPPPGDYVAKLNGKIVVYESQKGALCAALPCIISQGDHTGFTTKATVVLAKSDGTLMPNAIDNMKAVFGWDGSDPFWLMDGQLPDVEFALADCKHDTFEGNTYFKPGWVNPLGGGMKMPEAADRRSVLAKYGSKFRALAGGTTAKPAAAPAKPAPPTPKPMPKPAPVQQTGPTATMEEAWDACCHANQGNEEPAWHAAMSQMFPSKTNTDMTPHDWGKLKEKFADNVPK